MSKMQKGIRSPPLPREPVCSPGAAHAAAGMGAGAPGCARRFAVIGAARNVLHAGAAKPPSSRGFVYSLDAALAMFVLVFVIISAEFMLEQSETDSLSQLQLSRAGKDALAIMDKRGDLQSFNATRINGSLDELLPLGTRMHLRIDTYYYDNESFLLAAEGDFGPDISRNTTVFGARRDFVNIKNRQVTNYSIARAFIWTE